MKTRRLTTILTSAYLSAMLASSVAPIRSDATLASTIDPMAAQKALQSAVNSLEASGWQTASVASPAVVQPTPKIAPPPKADPVMTDELMARLIKYGQGNQKIGSIEKRLCKVLDLCDGTENLPLKILKGELTDAEHYFAVSVDANSKDVLIMVKSPTTIEAFLTDNTGKLRAAAILKSSGAYLITNEKAADKFAAELKQYAKEAATLPPSEAAVAGNS
jgi:hypothetical protein